MEREAARFVRPSAASRTAELLRFTACYSGRVRVEDACKESEKRDVIFVGRMATSLFIWTARSGKSAYITGPAAACIPCVRSLALSPRSPIAPFEVLPREKVGSA